MNVSRRAHVDGGVALDGPLERGQEHARRVAARRCRPRGCPRRCPGRRGAGDVRRERLGRLDPGHAQADRARSLRRVAAITISSVSCLRERVRLLRLGRVRLVDRQVHGHDRPRVEGQAEHAEGRRVREARARRAAPRPRRRSRRPAHSCGRARRRSRRSAAGCPRCARRRWRPASACTASPKFVRSRAPARRPRPAASTTSTARTSRPAASRASTTCRAEQAGRAGHDDGHAAPRGGSAG